MKIASAIPIAISGDIDECTVATALRRPVVARMASDPGDHIVDLGRVTFIGAAGLNALVDLRRGHADDGHSLTLSNVSDHQRRVFWAGRLALLLPVA